MSFSPTVSVIVPAFNAQSTLPACLASLCALAYPQALTEILVVDNNSHDNTRAIIESFAPQVRLLQEKKRGPAAARNCGIRHAQNQVVAFTDADCIVEPQWLTELIKPLHNENVGIVGGMIRAARPCGAIELFGERIHNQEKAIGVYKPAYVSGSNWASSRDTLTQLGMFDDTLRAGEDTDLAWRILQSGKELAYQPTAVIYHRNESTVRGLFYEGFQHGMASVPLLRKHRHFLRGFGYRRFYLSSYLVLLTVLRQYLATRSTLALCDFTFNLGKKLGKFAGSVRTGYLEL